MDLSFAKDSVLFSRVVEELRKEKLPITEASIKERYEAYQGKPATVTEGALPEDDAPKKKGKSKKK